MFWADKIVQEIIEKKTPPFKVYDSWTPSGMAHAGHIRTFLLHQAIYEGLKLAGQQASYSYCFDDMDPMDGFPPDAPEEWKRYMGMPLSKIPSYIDGYSSLGGYYSSKYLEAMEELDIHPEVPTTTQMYHNGEFNEAITIVLDSAQKIRDIYADLGSERPADWYPFQPICEVCGKIGTTYTYDWDGETVAYRCEPKMVEWAQGCSHDGRVSPYNGAGKMHWKVEWPSKWFLIKTAYEGGGKDHFTKNGSRDFGRKIITDVFHAKEPVGYAHEFFLLDGKKQSSSKGIGMTANEAAAILPPHVMRFFIYRTPINRQIEFSPAGDTIPKIYDEFDRGIEALKSDPDSNEARALIYSHQSESPFPEYVMRFSKVSFLIQMPHIDIHEMATQEKGSALTTEDITELDIRTEYARRWLDSYADDASKFTLAPELPNVELSPEQRVFLADISQKFNDCDWDGESLHGVIHDTKNTMQLAPKLAFSAMYRVFLNKDSGPQAGWFLAALDRSFVLNRLNEATR